MNITYEKTHRYLIVDKNRSIKWFLEIDRIYRILCQSTPGNSPIMIGRDFLETYRLNYQLII